MFLSIILSSLLITVSFGCNAITYNDQPYYPTDVCFGSKIIVSDDYEYSVSYNYLCDSSTTASLYGYNSSDCSGDAVYSSSVSVSECTDDGSACSYAKITQYTGSDGNCDATGSYVETIFITECYSIVDGVSYQTLCVDGTSLGAAGYDNNDCSGDPLTDVTSFEEGCQGSYYYEITCMGSGNANVLKIFGAVIAIIMVNLF